MKRTGFIYAMFNNRNGYTKIGFSSSFPVYREKTLQAEEPEVELVAFCPGTRRDERWWHKQLAAYRLRGEWFALGWEDYIEVVTTMDQHHAVGPELYNRSGAVTPARQASE